MVKPSAGLILYRRKNKKLEVLLVHPGGPFWSKKDLGVWSIPKGEVDVRDNGNLLSAARREFQEETGCSAEGEFVPLSPITLKSGKVIHAWVFEGDCDATTIQSNTFSMEWPPRSGKRQDFPEVDRAGWFDIEQAKKKINQGQVGFLRELQTMNLNKNND